MSERARFERDGFCILPGVLAPDYVASFEGSIAAEVARRTESVQHVPLAERSVYDRAFLQVTNLWLTTPEVVPLVMNARLASCAADLLGVERVRIYHDQALFKEGGGGSTPWHVDQYYWPLASDLVVTAWIPLQDTPLAMGPVEFAVGSHRLDLARDLPIGDESDAALESRVERVARHDFALGDVSFHGGWTCHRAGPNTTSRERRVFCVIYMDAEMRLAEPTGGQRADREAFCPGIGVGERIDSGVNPVVGG